MPEVKSVRVEFRGDGSEQLTGQYDSVIRKDKELEQQLGKGGQGAGQAAEKFDSLNESLGGFEQQGGIAVGISRGLALGLGALGNIAAQAAIQAVTWAIDEFNKSANQGQEYLDKFRGKADEMATSLLKVENAAGLAITRLNEYNSLRAGDSLANAGDVTRDKFKGFASGFMQLDAKLGGSYAEVGQAANLARDVAGTAKLDTAALDGFIAQLERLGKAANGTWRDELEPMREELIRLKAATEGTTPAIVTLTEVQAKQQARLNEQRSILSMTADEVTLLHTRTQAYNVALAENLKVTNISADRARELANARADEAVSIKAQELGVKNLAKAREEAARNAVKAAQEEAAEQRKLESFYTKVEGAIRRAEKARDDEAKAVQKRETAFEGYLKSLDTEYELMHLGNVERKIRIAQIQEEARLNRPGGAGLSSSEKADIAGRITRNENEQARLDLAKKEADEVAQVWEQARDSISDSWSDLWYGVFNDGSFKAGDFFKSLKSTWARTIADMIAMSTQNSIVQPLFEAMFGGMMGGGGAGGGTGSAGTRDIFKLFGGGGSDKAGSRDWMEENVYKPAGVGGGNRTGGMMGDIGEIAGGAMMGYGIGQIAGSGTGGAIGGAIGKMFGPIGSLVGSVIGGLIGGLMKSTPKSISSYGAGGVVDSMASGGLDVKIGKDMASAVVRALRTFSEQLVTGLEGDAFFGIVGQRGSKFFYQAQQTDLKVAGKKKYGAEKFDTAEEAISAAIEAAINSGFVKGLTDADKKLMRAATSVEQAMQDVVSSHNFKRELDFQFIGLSSPQGEAMARLEFEYQQQLILAEKYEADKTKLEAVYAQKRADLQKQYQEELYGGLKDYLVSLTGGSASPLSPTTKLNLAQARYNDLSSKAKGGDKDAIAALQGAAQDYLGAGRDVYASSGGYFDIYNRVVGDISGITGVANPLGAANSNTAVAAAVNDNSRLAAAAAAQAASQRDTMIAQNAQLNTNIAALVAALSRGSAVPTQNGTVQVGTVDWAGISQAVGSFRG